MKVTAGLTESEIKTKLEELTKEFDRSAKVVVAKRIPSGRKTSLRTVTFVIVTNTESEALVNALVRYCVEQETTIRFTGSEINMQAEKLEIDYLYIEAEVHAAKT